jgi:hypothetical protein
VKHADLLKNTSVNHFITYFRFSKYSSLEEFCEVTKIFSSTLMDFVIRRLGCIAWFLPNCVCVCVCVRARVCVLRSLCGVLIKRFILVQVSSEALNLQLGGGGGGRGGGAKVYVSHFF